MGTCHSNSQPEAELSTRNSRGDMTLCIFAPEGRRRALVPPPAQRPHAGKPPLIPRRRGSFVAVPSVTTRVLRGAMPGVASLSFAPKPAALANRLEVGEDHTLDILNDALAQRRAALHAE